MTNVVSRRASLDQVDRPVHVYQTNDGQSYVPLVCGLRTIMS